MRIKVGLSRIIIYFDRLQGRKLNELILRFFSMLIYRQIDETKSDAEYIAEYQQNGNTQIVALLLERYTDLIGGISMNALKNQDDVQDMIADLFMVLQEKLKHHEVKNFRSWLCTIVKNRLNDRFRKKKVRQEYATNYLATHDDGYELQNSFQFDLPLLQKAMGHLSIEEGQCIRQIYLEEMDYKDIMADSGWTFNQVRGYRQRGMKKLKEILRTDFEDYFKS